MCLTEAKELTALKTTLEEDGFGYVPFVAVVHQKLGSEQFRLYFRSGDLFVDPKREFYKAVGERWVNPLNVLNPRIISRWNEARKYTPGVIDGSLSSHLLGAVLVIGPGTQGIILEHREEEFGDYSNLEDIRNAVHQFSLYKKPPRKTSSSFSSSSSSTSQHSNNQLLLNTSTTSDNVPVIVAKDQILDHLSPRRLPSALSNSAVEDS